MAGRAGRIGWPGALAAALVLAVIVGPIVAVAMRAEGLGTLGPAGRGALRFTIWQAAVSALVSVALAIPVARALARRRFPGRGLLLTLLGAPFILPVIVATFGLLAVFGRAGLVNTGLAALGLPSLSIYGPGGVILAHVFLNLPLAVRMILLGWQAIPAERFRLAALLNAPVWRLLEAPMLARVVPGALVLVFLICLTSFAVALVLGGGPRATTVELAIYQAVRFDYALDRAATLALVQVALSAGVAALAVLVHLPDAMGAGMDRVVPRWGAGTRALDALWIAAAGLFLILPMAMIVIEGVAGFSDIPPGTWVAAARSLAVALASTAICMGLALALAVSGGRWAIVVGTLPVAASALVLGTGLYILLFPWLRPQVLALPVTVAMNALFALPFALRIVAPAVERSEAQFGRLADLTGLSGRARLRLLTLPRAAGALGFAAGLAAALSMGDLGVIALFAGQETETLPLNMYRLLGSYRSDAAAGAALLLLGLSLALFAVFDRAGRRC
ncbi:MAG: ABC-type thiamine uptake system permease component ThiP [Rhodobacteraceae bacterium HLUCCA08]|nr:MAG: ABC-type thiamine uptake system permease component ThiP [Rhodobacteraceae bacterium HLUCCA08]